MLKRLLKLFRRAPAPEPQPVQMPAPGEQWLLDDGSPWPVRYPPVKVLDVREGWVRYEMGWMFPDSRMEVASFVRIYRLAGRPA